MYDSADGELLSWRMSKLKKMFYFVLFIFDETKSVGLYLVQSSQWEVLDACNYVTFCDLVLLMKTFLDLCTKSKLGSKCTDTQCSNSSCLICCVFLVQQKI